MKKIVAREFLVFVAFILLIGISVLILFSYNYIQSRNVDIKQNKISQLSREKDVVIKPYRDKLKKRKWFYDLNRELGLLDFSSLNQERFEAAILVRFEKLAQKDSLIQIEKKINPRFLSLIVKNFGSINEFNKFLLKNCFTREDTLNIIKYDNLKIQIEKESKLVLKFKENKLNSYDMLYYLKWIAVILAFILFVLRYFYYSIIWSVNVLKNS
jgi:hypothetical protein